MTIFRSLKTLTTKNPNKTRSFLTSTTTTTTTTLNPLKLIPFAPLLNPCPLSPLPRSSSRFLSSPLSKWIAPFQGPLFLSFPPWKLSQSATPLHLRGNGVVFRKVEALNLNLNLLKYRTLGLGSGSIAHPTILGRVEKKEEISRETGLLEGFVNLPNFISLSRLVSGPLLGWMITNEMYSSAFVGLAISGATDWLDGYVARKMKIDSVVGSYLDPLADKVLIGCVALAMVHNDLLHPGLVGLVVLRDVALVGGAVYQRAGSLGWQWKSWSEFFNLDGTHPQKVQPLFISKVNTVFQLILVAAALLQPEFGTLETQSYITYLSWLVASTTVASTAAYGAQYMRKRSAMITRKA